jgi:hypothetical protein
MLRKPAFSRLGGFRMGGIGRERKVDHVLFVPLSVTFNQDEYAARLQALDKFSNSLSVV